MTIIKNHTDRVAPVANAEFLDQRLPASRPVIIDAGTSSGRKSQPGTPSAVLDSVTSSRS